MNQNENCFNNNLYSNKENNCYFNNKEKKYSDINLFYYNKNSFDAQNFFNNEIKSGDRIYGIETKYMNLGSLTKNNNLSNLQKYNKHSKLISNNYYYNLNRSQDENRYTNKSLANYYIRW